MIAYVELEKVLPNPWQTRGEPSAEHVQALADDIEKNGLLQRPAGRLVIDGKPVDINVTDAIGGSGELGEVFQVQLAFGHNRLAAFKLLAAKSPDVQTIFYKLPVEIYMLDDEKMAQAAWSENEKRRDLSPMERARAVQQRMEGFGWTQALTAEKLGLSRTAVANITRLLDLPQNIQDELDAGNISERSAMALLPLYEVSQEVRGRMHSYWGSPEQVIVEAVAGASSDVIRKRVNEMFERSFQSLHDAPFKLAELFPEGGAIYCGLCSTCDKRLASRNLCMDQMCYEAKLQVVWHRYLEAASLASGYEIIDESKGGYPSSLPYDKARLEKILATKCKNLRLAYDTSGNGKDDPRRISGHPKALLVCDKRNDSCTCVKGLGKLAEMERSNSGNGARPEVVSEPVILRNETELLDFLEHPKVVERKTDPTPAELENVMRQARKDKKDAIEKSGEIERKLADLLAQELANDSVGAFFVLVRQYVWPDYRGMQSLESLYKEAGTSMARRFMPNNYDSVAQIMEYVNGRLDALELPQLSLEKTLVELFEEAEL